MATGLEPLAPGAEVLVTGAGITGRAIVSALASWDVHITVCDDNDSALELLSRNGIHTGTPADAVALIGTFDLVVTFSLTQRNVLMNYINNGGYTSGSSGYADFGFGFDADCHYFNDRIWLVVDTAPASVPDGGLTGMLVGFGLIGLAAIRRLRVG